jgi:Xylanase inhibitor N-terminal
MSHKLIGEILLVLMFLSEWTLGSSSDKSSVEGIITLPLIPHHVQRQRRLEADPLAMIPDALYQGFGTHYVDLWVGTPPQRQTVIVDTGSSITSFPCSECANCGTGYHIDEYFQELNSVTFQIADCTGCTIGYCQRSSSQCELSMSYQEGSSWNAFEAKDTIYIGGHHDTPLDHPKESFSLTFGCQTHLTGLFKTQLADGIAGMEVRFLMFPLHQDHTVLTETFLYIYLDE